MDDTGRTDEGVQRHCGKNTELYNRGGQRENSSKWNMKGSIAKRILLQNGKPADTIMKTLGWRTGTPLGRSGMGITIPIEIGEVYRNRKKITQNTISISKKKRTERNGKKIPFIPDWAHRKQERNNAGKYKTVAIEEEDKTTIGFMREHDTDPRPEIQTTKISPRGFPIETGKPSRQTERAYEM